MGAALVSELELATARGGEDDKFECRNGGREGEVHGQGSQGVQGQVQSQGQGQVHWNHGYRRGSGATTYASTEENWLTERLSGSEGLVRGRGRRRIDLLHAHPDLGGGLIYQCWHTLLVAVAEAKK